MISDVYFPRINGVSTSIQIFRRELQRLGCRVTLVAPEYTSTNKLSYSETDDILRVPARRLILNAEDKMIKAKYLRDILQFLADQDQDYDIVHIQTPFVAHHLGTKIAEHLKLPVVETYHTFFEEYLYHYIPFLPKAWLRYLARWFTVKQCNTRDALIVPSHAMQEKLRDYGVRCNIAIIPTGIELDRFQGGDGARFRHRRNIPQDRPLLVYVGRVAFEKNIGFLLEVYARLRQSQPEALFLIAGEGPALKSLQRQARDLGIDDGIYFAGYLARRSELLDCYKSGDLFVFASRTETQGLVLLEALALGVPVVSTAVMGTRDILQRAQGAVIAEEDIEAFSDTIDRLLRDPVRRQLLSTRGKHDAEQWAAPHFAHTLLDFYQRLQRKQTPKHCMVTAASGKSS